MLTSATPDCVQPQVFNHRRMRNELLDWLRRERCSHALTLVTNRAVTVANIKRMFGEFCLDLDRECLGVKNVGNKPSGDRLFALGFIEHPETNIHIHAALRLDAWWPTHAGVPVARHIERIWKKVTRGSGDAVLREVTDDGWGLYMMKKARLIEGAFLLSTDYHPKH